MITALDKNHLAHEKTCLKTVYDKCQISMNKKKPFPDKKRAF